LHEQLQAIITVLSLINPAICAAMFAQAVAGQSLGEKITDSTRADSAVLIILTVAALLGMQLLNLFGVSLDAFMVAGGGVLAWMGFSMLSGQPAAVDSRSKQSLTPLILFAASPGTITGVITLSVAHTRMTLPLTSLVAIAVATGITWLAMLLVAHFGRKRESGGFLRDTLTRFMGLIVLSMGVQFALTGYRAFMK
jgi:multiple antibiotic resistance protein